MVTIYVTGGIGNQMFQYAMGRALALRNGVSLQLDISWYGRVSKNTVRHFALDEFAIHATLSKSVALNVLRRCLIKTGIISAVKEKKLFAFDGDMLAVRRGYVDGFWQSEEYFRDVAEDLRKDFSLRAGLRDRAMAIDQAIRREDSVAIHIRRGDYVTNQEAGKYHGVCSLEYYQRAIAYVKSKIERPHFFVFSDDIAWVKEHLPVGDPVEWVSGGAVLTDAEELILMSHCRHQIIANSSFSWWAAWLNENPTKIVIAPRQWIVNNEDDASHVAPQSWIKM